MSVVLSRKGGGSGGSAAGVSSLDGLTGAVTLSAGSNITLTPTGNDIEIAASGAGWTVVVDEPGSTLTGWTQDSGTWSIANGGFSVDATGAATARLAFDTAQNARSPFILEAEVNLVSAGIGASGRAGLLAYWDGTGDSGLLTRLNRNGGTTRVDVELDAVSAITSFTRAFALDTFHLLRVIYYASALHVYLAGSPLGLCVGTNLTLPATCKIGFCVIDASCVFRNLKLYELAALP